MLTQQSTKETKRPRGPARLSYIPPQYRHIPGIHNLSTRRQLLRLREYLANRADRRVAYLRLGASVPSCRLYPGHPPSATYVVGYDEVVEVIRFEGDPRRAEHWFSRPERPWNLAREFAEETRA